MRLSCFLFVIGFLFPGLRAEAAEQLNLCCWVIKGRSISSSRSA